MRCLWCSVRGGRSWGLGLAALFLAAGVARADRLWNRPGWRMTFDDEFSAEPVNPAKWNVENGPNPANEEKQWYSPDNVFVEYGNLVLKSEVRTINGYPFASGKVTTAGKFSPHFGRIEIRADLPTGPGIWPAHWMLGYRGWPPEIDITELIGSAPKNLVVSHHRTPLPPGCVYPWDCGMTHNATIWWNMDWTQGFHVFALEWDWWGIRWFVDGVEVFASYYPPPDEPMFLILNTAVGGKWPGWPDGSTPWPQWHLIDYVRMYERYYGRSVLNGGFEEQEDGGFLNWNTLDAGNIVPEPTLACAHSGAGAARLYGRFDSPTNASWLYQDLAAQEGEIWEASVWAANRPGDLVQGANQARFKLEFIDGFGAILARHAVTAVDRNTPAAYARHVMRQKAPPWTTHARIVMEFNQAGYAAGAADFDDAELFRLAPDADASLRTLANAGFEAGDGDDFVSWNAYGPTGSLARETTPSNVDEGDRSLRLRPHGGAETNRAGLYQDIPARPAEQWTAAVRARAAVDAPLAGANRAVLKLEFVDATGAIIQRSETNVVNAASVPGFAGATLQAYAPANAAYARLVVEYVEEPGGGGSAVFDRATLSTVADGASLLNPGLELHDGTNFPGWTAYGEGWNVVRDPQTANARSGEGALQLFGRFNGAANESGLFQDMAAAEGEIWQASGWAQNRPGDGLQGGNHAKVKLEFLDAHGAVLDRDEITVARANSASFYRSVTLRRAAPDWTAKARLVLALFQTNNANGSVNFDDAELRRVTAADARPALNGGFEEGDGDAFLNWPSWNVHQNLAREPSTGLVHSGTQALKIFGTFQDGDNRSGLFQDFPAAPDEMWQGSVWARNRPGDLLQGGNGVRLKIEFLGTNGATRATNALTILTAASSTNFARHAVRRRAPAGTDRARLVLEFHQTNWNAGAAVIDDADMRVVTAADADRPLLNGSFETGVGAEYGEWVPYGPGSLENVVRDANPAYARTGTQCLKLYGAFSGASNSSGLYQDIPAAAGELWQAGVWARNRPGDVLEGANRAVLKLEFVDRGGAVLQGDHVVAVTAGSPTNYRSFALRREAPAGAAFARIVLQFDQSEYAAGAAGFDDATLELVTARNPAGVLNGGFEDRGSAEPLMWTRYDAGFNVLLDTNEARTGSTALRMFGRFTGGTNNSDVYQDAPAVEGQLWQASVWAAPRPGDLLQGGNQAKMKLEFLDAGRNLLVAAEQAVVTAASPTGFVRRAVLRAAPAGATWARLVLDFTQAANAGGAALFDDAALDVVPMLTGVQAAASALWAGPLRPQGAVVPGGDLRLAADANLEVRLFGAHACCDHDRLDSAGRVAAGGTLTISLPETFGGQPFVPRPGQVFRVVSGSEVSGAFASVIGPPALGGGASFALAYQPTAVVLQVVAELDRDQDGLPDYWEAQWFASPTGADPLLDSDGDGFANAAEYAADTSPKDPRSRFVLDGLVLGPSGPSVLFPSATGRLYTLSIAADAVDGTWTNHPARTDRPGGVPLDDPDPPRRSRLYRVGVRAP